ARCSHRLPPPPRRMWRVIQLLVGADRRPLIAIMNGRLSRTFTCLAACAGFAVAGCHGDDAAGPSLPVITTADLAAAQQAITIIDAIMADPALASTRTVSVPFNL